MTNSLDTGGPPFEDHGGPRQEPNPSACDNSPWRYFCIVRPNSGSAYCVSVLPLSPVPYVFVLGFTKTVLPVYLV